MLAVSSGPRERAPPTSAATSAFRTFLADQGHGGPTELMLETDLPDAVAAAAAGAAGKWDSSLPPPLPHFTLTHISNIT